MYYTELHIHLRKQHHIKKNTSRSPPGCQLIHNKYGVFYVLEKLLYLHTVSHFTPYSNSCRRMSSSQKLLILKRFSVQIKKKLLHFSLQIGNKITRTVFIHTEGSKKKLKIFSNDPHMQFSHTYQLNASSKKHKKTL